MFLRSISFLYKYAIGTSFPTKPQCFPPCPTLAKYIPPSPIHLSNNAPSSLLCQCESICKLQTQKRQYPKHLIRPSNHSFSTSPLTIPNPVLMTYRAMLCRTVHPFIQRHAKSRRTQIEPHTLYSNSTIHSSSSGDLGLRGGAGMLMTGRPSDLLGEEGERGCTGLLRELALMLRGVAR